MSTSGRAARRFEILLPLRFNDGTRVPARLVARTKRELRTRFGALSFETQMIEGTWIHKGQTYFDELERLFLDVEDSAESLAFFRRFKENLKQRFRQVDIWIVHHGVEIV